MILSGHFGQGFAKLQPEDFGCCISAGRAFEVMACEVATLWMGFDVRKLYRLAAFRAGVIRAQIKRHGVVLSREAK